MSTDTSLHLPESLRDAFEATLTAWSGGRVERLWQRDPALWTSTGEERWLGWLDVAERTLGHAAELTAFAHEVRDAGLRHVLLLGMGGSSLCPEVLAHTFGRQDGWPELLVLDSTHPDQIRRCEAAVDLERTLVIVASKSGSTLEPSILLAHFQERLRETVGRERAGAHFVAITDPGSQLDGQARRDGFRRVFSGEPAVGGRFSALSAFGMVPAALMGLDVARLLGTAIAMSGRCRATDAAANPGVLLGAAIGTAARAGHDKLTLVLPPEVAALGSWLEQLIAESTGKNGVAILPVEGEPLLAAGSYGEDRCFVVVHLGGRDRRLQPHAQALAAARQPVIEIVVEGIEALSAEFFRWEIATAVAGAVLGVNPFDQPDVEAAKIASRKLTEEYERSGELPAEPELHREDGITLRTDARNAAELRTALGDASPSLAGYLKAHLARLGPDDYFALLAFLDRGREEREILERIRRGVLEHQRVATTLGFGPRYLHSTGQAHKGGPPSGVFVVLTGEPVQDLPVPGSALSFGTVVLAQAGGDLAVLLERGRRALHVELGADPSRALRRLARAIGGG